MSQFHALCKFGHERCPVYLLLPWLGSFYTWFEKQVKSVVKQCFSAVEPRVVYSTSKLLSATNKDVLPALQKSNVIKQFSFHCDSQYVGRTSQRLQDRIKQHVPKSICFCSFQKCLLLARWCRSSSQTNTPSLASDSAIGLIFYKILLVLYIMMTLDFLFLPKVALFSIYLLWKPLFVKTSNPTLC